MRKVLALAVPLAVAVVACESPQGALWLGPTPLAGPATTGPTPSPAPPTPLVPHPRVSDASPLEIGETVHGQTIASDPLCDPAWPHHCRYFKITSAHTGLLHVTLRWSISSRDPYPLDIAVYAPNGGEWLPVVGPGTQRRVDVVVDSGGTYLVEVWSFLTPGEPFELTSSLEPR